MESETINKKEIFKELELKTIEYLKENGNTFVATLLNSGDVKYTSACGFFAINPTWDFFTHLDDQGIIIFESHRIRLK